MGYKRKSAAGVAAPQELSKAARTPLAVVHLWLGRVVILLGGINAVLGFVLAGSKAGAIAIGVCALVWYIVVVALVVLAARKGRPRQGQRGGSSPRSSGGPDAGSDGLYEKE